MLSNIFIRLLTSVRPAQNYQQHFLRLLSTAQPNSTENMSNDRETGVVKRFSKEKGYGFISKNSDGTDCFVHFKNINTTGFKTLEQGQEVEFSSVQGEKGLEARDVSVINTGTGRAPFGGGGGSYDNNSTSSRFGFGGSPRNQSSSGFNFGGTTSSRFQSREQDSTSNDRSFDYGSGLTNSRMDNSFSPRRPRLNNDQRRETGSVKRWTEERGFGFIRRANGGQDLFCHVRSLQDGMRTLEEGQTVEFTIQRTDKGEEARDVSIFDGEVSPSRQQENTSTTDPDERQTGIVRKWLPEKGYGFLRRDTGGSDIFVHLRELTDGTSSLEEGQTVEFNITSNEKGDIAQNVTVRSEA